MSRDEHPSAFAEDGLHPNERSLKIMAEAWCRTSAGSKARKTIIAKMHAHPHDIESMMRSNVQTRRVE